MTAPPISASEEVRRFLKDEKERIADRLGVRPEDVSFDQALRANLDEFSEPWDDALERELSGGEDADSIFGL